MVPFTGVLTLMKDASTPLVTMVQVKTLVPQNYGAVPFTQLEQIASVCYYPYRPFGDAIRNRFEMVLMQDLDLILMDALHCYKMVLGLCSLYHCVICTWCYAQDSIPTQGSKATKAESTEYVPSWELNFELDPLNEHDREIVKQWYETWQQANKITAQMPRVPTKGELYSWWMSHVVNSDRDITNEEAVLAQSLLED